MPLATPPGIVLDTNVLLAWLVFQDPVCQPLAEALEAGRVRWLAVPAMRREWEAVLARGVGAVRAPDAAVLDAAWARHACWLPEPPPGVGLRHRCTDPDDQKFIDLALHADARWLLTRDRAVLKLARRARASGLLIGPPERWSPEVPPGSG